MHREKNYLWDRDLFLGWQIWRAQLCLDWALGTGAELEAVLKTGSLGGKVGGRGAESGVAEKVR